MLPVTRALSLSFCAPTSPAAAASSSPTSTAANDPFEGHTMQLPEALRQKFLDSYARSFSITSQNRAINCTFSLSPFTFFRELNALLEAEQTAIFGNGSTPASFFNPAIKPNDTDFLYRQLLTMDESAFHALPDKIKYLQNLLDKIRDAIEVICRRHASLEHLDLLTIFYAFFQKHSKSNDDTHCYGVVRLGSEFEIKYCIDIVLTNDGKIVRRIPGVDSCSFIQNDLLIPLNAFINGADPLTHPVMLLSLKYPLHIVMNRVLSNTLDNDEINGSTFFALMKKFTCTGGAAQLEFMTLVSQDLTRIMSPTEVFGRLSYAIKEGLQTHRIGSICTLLNACAFIEDDNLGRLLLDCVKDDTVRRQLHKAGHFPLYLAFFKVLFITAHCLPGQTGHISIECYEKQSYRLLIPKDLVTVFIHFFKALKDVPQDLLMDLYKKCFPQVQLKKEIKTPEALLTTLIQKGFGLVTLQEQQFLSHYLLFNFPSLYPALKEGLIHCPGYLPILQDASLDDKLALYHIPSPPDIQTLLIPHDPQLALIGLQLIEHLEVPLQWAIQFTVESMVDVNERLFFRLAPQAIAKELLTALRYSRDFEYLIQLFAQSAHVQINELACSLWMRAYERKMECADALLETLVYTLKDIEALRPSLKAIFSKNPKLSYLTSLLKLTLNSAEGTLETFTKIDMSSLKDSQIVYMHSCVHHFINKAIATTTQRTTLKKLIHLFLSLPPLQAPSDLLLQDKKELFFKLSSKATLYRELMFELLPKIISDGYLQDRRFVDLLSSLLLSSSMAERVRILHVFKQHKYCPNGSHPIDNILQVHALQCIVTTTGVATAKVWMDLKSLIYKESLSQELLGAALQQLASQEKLLEAISFLTIISSNELYTLLSPCPRNQFYTASSHLITELQRGIDKQHPDAESYFKCCVNHLYILKDHAKERSCYQMLQHWQTPILSTFSEEYAHKLLSILKVRCNYMIPFLTSGCLATKDPKAVVWISNRLEELFKKQQTTKYFIEISFQYLVAYHINTSNEYVADDLLSHLIEAQIFNDLTTPCVWLSVYQILLPALEARSHESAESRRRYIARLRQGMAHPTVLRLLTEYTDHISISPFYHFIKEMQQQERPGDFSITCLQMFQNLLTSRKEGRLVADCDNQLLVAFGVLLKSEHPFFQMEHWSTLISNFLTLHEIGLLEGHPYKKMGFLEIAALPFTTVAINLFLNAQTQQELHQAHQFALQVDSWFSKTIYYDTRYPVVSAKLIRNRAILLTTASVADESLLLKLFSVRPTQFLCAIEHLYGMTLGASSYFDHSCAFPEKHIVSILSLLEHELSQCEWTPSCSDSNNYVYEIIVHTLITLCAQKSFALIPRVFTLLRCIKFRPECDLSLYKIHGIETLRRFTDCHDVILQLQNHPQPRVYSGTTPYSSIIEPLVNTIDTTLLLENFSALHKTARQYIEKNISQHTLKTVLEKSIRFINECRHFPIFPLSSMEKITASIELLLQTHPEHTVYLDARHLVIKLFIIMHSCLEPLKYRSYFGDTVDICTLSEVDLNVLFTHVGMAISRKFGHISYD